jgi:hypothetical protein
VTQPDCRILPGDILDILPLRWAARAKKNRDLRCALFLGKSELPYKLFAGCREPNQSSRRPNRRNPNQPCGNRGLHPQNQNLSLILSTRIGLRRVRPRRRKHSCMSDELLQIQKRLTLNWLIQGASQHAGLTLHHLIREELDALDKKLLPQYDEFALVVLLQYWRGLSVLFIGRPRRFWDRARSDSSHPFFNHPLLSTYGGILAEASKQHALNRCREKGYIMLPFLFSFRALAMVKRIRAREIPFRPELVGLAKQTAMAVWGLPRERFDAELTKEMPIPAHHFQADNFHARHLRSCVIGYSHVTRNERQLIVAAKGITWQLLTKELVKGAAELICMHGLSQLQDRTYRQVIEAADRLEYEPWLLQSGGELWRRLLAALPDDSSIAHVLMHLARLPPEALHSIIADVINESESASRRLADLVQCGER